MDVETVHKAHEDVNTLYHDVYDVMARLTAAVQSKKYSDADLCDMGFFCKQMESLLDELRKETKARKELIGRIIAFNRTKAFIADPTIDPTVRGKYATGTPDVRQEAELPKKGTDEYFAFTDHFGVPRGVAEQGILKLDWNSVGDMCTQLAEDGKKMPPGLGRMIPKYVTTFRKKGKESNG